jgi:hypothetical protein
MSHYIHLNHKNTWILIFVNIYTFQEENVDKAYGTKWGAIGTCWATHWELDKHVENPSRTSHMHLPTNQPSSHQVSHLLYKSYHLHSSPMIPPYRKKKESFKLKNRYLLLGKAWCMWRSHGVAVYLMSIDACNGEPFLHERTFLVGKACMWTSWVAVYLMSIDAMGTPFLHERTFLVGKICMAKLPVVVYLMRTDG